MLNELWLSEPDGGVRSSTRLVASRLGIDLPPTPVGEHGRWRTDCIGEGTQDFAIIEPCVVEIGKPRWEPVKALTAPWNRHARRFTRRIAIALNEVTIRQFRDYVPGYRSTDSMLIGAPPEAAIMGVTLDDARRFCNAMSERAGLVACYEVRLNAKGMEIVVPKPNHLDLSGYRLPTDGEWELACRAGTTTSRYFGNLAAAVASYGWMKENNNAAGQSDRGTLPPQRVAEFLPNRWGLFDCYGNAKELCDTSLDPVDELEEIEDAVVPIDSWEESGFPTLRGLSIVDSGTTYARSHIRTKQIVGWKDPTVGLRVARTIANTELPIK